MTTDLTSIGWDKRRVADYAPFAHPSRVPGRVVRTERGVCTVITAGGAVRASVAGSALAEAACDLTRLPCVGDWVVVRSWSDRRLTIDTVLPRTTTVLGERTPLVAGGLAGRALVANADVVAVVEPLGAGPDLRRVDRLLTIARRSGAESHVVLTKRDLVVESEISGIVDTVAAVAAGATVHVVSVRQDRPDSVRCQLGELVGPGHTLAILGPPASGRSSLVNALAGASATAAWGAQRAVAVVRRSGHRNPTPRASVPASPADPTRVGVGGQTRARPAGGPILVALPFGGAVVDVPLLPGAVVLDVPGLWTRKLS